MSINNTTLLGLAQPVTGQESGVWGDDINNGTTQLIEVSIVGSNTISYDGNVTLSVSNGSNASSFGSTTTTSTSSGVAQYPTLILTGARTALRTITAPSSSRIYRVINQTTGGYNTIVNGSATTGVSIPPGASATLIWNGSDFQGVSTVVGNLTFTDTNILSSFQTSVNTYSQIVNQNSNSGTTASADFIVGNNNTTATTYYGDFGMNSSGFTGSGAFNAANAVYLTSTSGDLALGTTTVNAIHFVINSGTTDAMTINTSGALALNGSYGTSGQVLTSGGSSAVPTWTTITGTVPSPFTANGVVYASSTSALATGSALTFDGSQFSVLRNGTGTIASFNGRSFDTPLLVTGAGSSGNSIGDSSSNALINFNTASGALQFYANGSEKMRLTSTGLGIGTSSPGYLLDVRQSSDGTIGYFRRIGATNNPALKIVANETGNTVGLDTDYSASGPAITFSTAGTERMRIDTSGNLGLGVTPSAWSGPTAIQVGPYGGFAGSSTYGVSVSSNAYAITSGWTAKYISSNYATLYLQQVSNGQHQWYTAPSGTAGNAISFTQAMTLDNSGNLLVGATSANGYKLNVQAGGSGAVTCFDLGAGNIDIVGGSLASNVGYIGMGGSHSLAFTRSGTTESMRIDSSGNVLVGRTNQYNSEKFSVQQSNNGQVAVFAQTYATSNVPNLQLLHSYATGANTATQVQFLNAAGSTVGSITSTSAATAYLTSSDQRLKTNIVDAPAGNIDQIKIRSFDWKSDGSHNTYGVIAQELLEVAPYAVHQPANPDEMMGVDYSKLVPMMIKEIQSLKAEVATLKGA